MKAGWHILSNEKVLALLLKKHEKLVEQKRKFLYGFWGFGYVDKSKPCGF